MRNELRVLLLFSTELVLLLVFRAHLRRLRRLRGLAGRDDLWTGCHTCSRCPRSTLNTCYICRRLVCSSDFVLWRNESDVDPSAPATNHETKKAHLYADIQLGMCKVQLVDDWWWWDTGYRRLANRLALPEARPPRMQHFEVAPFVASDIIHPLRLPLASPPASYASTVLASAVCGHEITVSAACTLY